MISAHMESFVPTLDIAQGVSVTGEIKSHVAFLQLGDCSLIQEMHIQPLSQERIPHPVNLLGKGSELFGVVLKESSLLLLSGNGQVGRQGEIRPALEVSGQRAAQISCGR